MRIVGEDKILKYVSFSQTFGTKIAKTAVLTEMIYGFNWVLTKFPMTFFIEKNPAVLKITQKKKKVWIWKTSNCGCITISDFKLYCRAIGASIACYGEQVEEKPHVLKPSDSFLWKDIKSKRDSPFTIGARKYGYSHAEDWN